MTDTAAWLALVCFAVIPVWPSLLGETVFYATDTIESLEPWESLDPAPSTPINGWLGDTIDAVGPRTILVVNSLRSGDFAQWNPFVAGGVPALPVPDNAPFSPLTLPWYVVPFTYAPGLVKVLEIGTIALGMSLLGRRWRLPAGSWAIASIVFASSGYMIAWTNWSQTRVAAFIPLLFWAVERAVAERRARDSVPIAVVVAAMLAGGFPSVTGWALYFAGAYAVVRAFATRSGDARVWRALLVSGAGVVLGIALLAWQILPFTQSTLASVDMDLRAQEGGALGWRMLANTVVPDLLGGPSGEAWGTTSNPIESFSYIGAAAVTLALVGFVVRRRPALPRGVWSYVFGSLALSSVLVYLGGPLLWLVHHLPIFDSSPIARMRVIVGFLAALAAALGYAAIVGQVLKEPLRPVVEVQPDRGSARISQIARTVFTVAGCALLVLVVVQVLDLVPITERSRLVREAWIAAGLATLTAGLAIGARRRPVAGLVLFGLVVPALVAVPAVGVARTWWPNSSIEYFYPWTPTHQYLADHLGGDRYIGVDWMMLAGTSTAYGLRAANGHAFHAATWVELLERVDPTVMRSRTVSMLSSGHLATSLDSGILDRMAVRYVVLPTAVMAPGTWDLAEPSEGTVSLAHDDALTATVSGPLRGISLRVPEGIQAAHDGAVLEIEVRDEVGRLVTVATRTFGVDAEGPVVQVAVAGDGIEPDETVYLTLRIDGVREPVVVESLPDAEPAIDLLRPLDDDLRVVATGGATIVERSTALSRVRWASEEVVVTDPSDRLDLLESGDLRPDAVVLQDPRDAQGTSASSASVEVVRETTDTIDVEVSADGPGWLVVADNHQGVRGWRAYLDGEVVQLTDVDHAMGAVAVPSGQHEIKLVFVTPGAKTGAVVSAVTILLLGSVWFVRRPRPTRAHPQELK